MMKRELNIIARTHANWYWEQDTWKYHFWMMLVENVVIYESK